MTRQAEQILEDNLLTQLQKLAYKNVLIKDETKAVLINNLFVEKNKQTAPMEQSEIEVPEGQAVCRNNKNEQNSPSGATC